MEINVKKYVIKKLIEAYAAKYPFLDENDYRSLAIKNYTEHEIGHVLGSEDPNTPMSKEDLDAKYANQLTSLYNTLGDKSVPLYLNGKLNPLALKYMRSNPQFIRGFASTKAITKDPSSLNDMINGANRNALTQRNKVPASVFSKRSLDDRLAMINSIRPPQG